AQVACGGAPVPGTHTAWVCWHWATHALFAAAGGAGTGTRPQATNPEASKTVHRVPMRTENSPLVSASSKSLPRRAAGACRVAEGWAVPRRQSSVSLTRSTHPGRVGARQDPLLCRGRREPFGSAPGFSSPSHRRRTLAARAQARATALARRPGSAPEGHSQAAAAAEADEALAVLPINRQV